MLSKTGFDSKRIHQPLYLHYDTDTCLTVKNVDLQMYILLIKKKHKKTPYYSNLKLKFALSRLTQVNLLTPHTHITLNSSQGLCEIRAH